MNKTPQSSWKENEYLSFINSNVPGEVESPLFELSARDDESWIGRAILLAIEKGWDIHEKDESGFTPLCHSALSGGQMSAMFLIDAGANPFEELDLVNSRGGEKWSPISLAESMGREMIALFMTEYYNAKNEKNLLSDSSKSGKIPSLKRI